MFYPYMETVAIQLTRQLPSRVHLSADQNLVQPFEPQVPKGIQPVGQFRLAKDAWPSK